MRTDVKLHTVFLATAAFSMLAACNPAPASETTAPAAPPAAEIAAPTTPSGPAAENTSDTLASAPPAGAMPAAPDAAPAPPVAPPAAAAAAAGPTKEELANGAAVYTRTCALCHGPSGEGTVMALALTAGHEASVIKEKVTKGVIKPGDKMPPLAAGMSAQDLNDVAKFVEAGLPK
jgi:mono/diheme cytochrome c family protein